MNDKSPVGYRLANHPVIVLIGLIASCIGIITFISGADNISAFFTTPNSSPSPESLMNTDSTIAEAPTTDLFPVVSEPTREILTVTPDRLFGINLLYEVSIINTYGTTTDVLAFDQTGDLFALGCDQDVCIYEIGSGSLIKRLYGHSDRVMTVAFSSNNQYVASGALDGNIMIWDLNNDGSLLNTVRHLADWGDPDYLVYAIQFLPDNKNIIVADSSMSINIYDAFSGSVTRSFDLENSYTHRLSISSDGQYVAGVSGHNEVTVWNIANGNRIFSWKSPNHPVFSPNGAEIALSNFNAGGINLYSMSSGNIRTRFVDDRDTYYQAYSFHPGGEFLFGCADDFSHVWRISDGELLDKLQIDTDTGTASWCWDIQVSPDGLYLATIAFGGPLRIWSLQMPTN